MVDHHDGCPLHPHEACAHARQCARVHSIVHVDFRDWILANVYPGAFKKKQLLELIKLISPREPVSEFTGLMFSQAYKLLCTQVREAEAQAQAQAETPAPAMDEAEAEAEAEGVQEAEPGGSDAASAQGIEMVREALAAEERRLEGAREWSALSSEQRARAEPSRRGREPVGELFEAIG